MTVPAASGVERPGAPIFLIHPINMRKECWLGLVPTLAAERACVLIDLAGHGESTDDEFSLAAWVEDCRDVLDALGFGAVHLAGGSLGGTIALGIAATEPGRALSVTGIGSTVDPVPPDAAVPPAPADDAAVEALFAELAREAARPGAPSEVVESIRHLTNRHGADVVTRVLAAAYAADANGWLDDVRSPVLWMTGEHDVTCTVADGRRAADRLGARYVALPSVGHLPMVEDPELVLTHLVPFLRECERRTTSRDDGDRE